MSKLGEKIIIGGVEQSELGEKIINAVREAAAKAPDFVYNRETPLGKCIYVKNGQPSCLVGHALWAVGLIDADTEGFSWNDDEISTVVAQSEWGKQLTDGEVGWLEIVQSEQDSGTAWRYAVRMADDAMARMEQDSE